MQGHPYALPLLWKWLEEKALKRFSARVNLGCYLSAPLLLGSYFSKLRFPHLKPPDRPSFSSPNLSSLVSPLTRTCISHGGVKVYNLSSYCCKTFPGPFSQTMKFILQGIHQSRTFKVSVQQNAIVEVRRPYKMNRQQTMRQEGQVGQSALNEHRNGF